MVTSLRMIEKVNKVNEADVTYGLMEKYNASGEIIEYVVAKNPVEQIGEFVNYTWDSGDYFLTSVIEPLKAKANAYDMLMCRAGYREEPNYRKVDRELERDISYEDLKTISLNAVSMLSEQLYDTPDTYSIADYHKEELASELGIESEEAKKFFGLNIKKYKLVDVEAVQINTYHFIIAVPENADEYDYENYINNSDFDEEVDCDTEYEYSYLKERLVSEDEARNNSAYFFEKEI